MKFKNIKNKKAVIGKTIGWFLATVLIFFILIISIFITSSIKRSKEFLMSEKTDLLAEKSLTSYLMTEDEYGEKIFYQIVNEENLNDFNGNLAKTIFLGLYAKDYPSKIWLGIYFKEPLKYTTNKYFGGILPIAFPNAPPTGRVISQEIHLKENKFLRLDLTKSR